MRRGTAEVGLKLGTNAEQARGPETPEAIKHGENAFRSVRRRKDPEASGESDEEFSERGVVKISSAVAQLFVEAGANVVDELLCQLARWHPSRDAPEEPKPQNGTAQRAAQSGTSTRHRIRVAARSARTDQRSCPLAFQTIPTNYGLREGASSVLSISTSLRRHMEFWRNRNRRPSIYVKGGGKGFQGSCYQAKIGICRIV
jgi:hypothetical protein